MIDSDKVYSQLEGAMKAFLALRILEKASTDPDFKSLLKVDAGRALEIMAASPIELQAATANTAERLRVLASAPELMTSTEPPRPPAPSLGCPIPSFSGCPSQVCSMAMCSVGCR